MGGLMANILNKIPFEDLSSRFNRVLDQARKVCLV